jgi:hypothetical protein
MHALLHILRDRSSVTSQLQPPSLPLLPPTLIFTPTRLSCERTASFLSTVGFAASALHGGCSLQHILQQQQLLQQRAISCIGARLNPFPCFCPRRRVHGLVFSRWHASCNGRYEQGLGLGWGWGSGAGDRMPTCRKCR